MRLFLGFAPVEAECRGIYEVGQRLSFQPPLPLRWTPPDNWHVTLVFLGEVAAHLVSQLDQVVSSVVSGYRAMALQLDSAEWFPSASKPRLLALHAEVPDRLLELQRALASALRGQGYPVEQRPWRPHLTLARYPGARRHFAPPPLPPFAPVTLELREVTLFESVPGASGPRYRALQQFELAP